MHILPPADNDDPNVSPTNEKLLEMVVVESAHPRLIGNNFNVSDLRLCGTINITVHVYDVSQGGVAPSGAIFFVYLLSNKSFFNY